MGMGSPPPQGSVIPLAAERSGVPAGFPSRAGALPVRAPGMCGTATDRARCYRSPVLLCIKELAR